MSADLLPDVAPELRTRAPRLTVVWSEEKTGDRLQALAGGRLDVALLAQGAHLWEFQTETVGVDPFVLAGRRDHPLFQSKCPARLSELEGESVLLLRERAPRSRAGARAVHQGAYARGRLHGKGSPVRAGLKKVAAAVCAVSKTVRRAHS